MQWIQTRESGGLYRQVRRFKCNRCGTTAEIRHDPASSDHEIPEGWRFGTHQGWHFCPGCERPARRRLLPVIG